MMTGGLPLFDRIDCVRLAVPNLEAGLHFYHDQLGHDLIWRIDSAAGLRLPGTDAEIVIHTDSIPPEIDFKVDSVDSGAQRFEAAGGKIVVPPFDIQIGRCAVVQDPWGNRLVLLDFSKGVLLTDEDGNVIGNQPPDL
jgi:lactoylglutathione lyase